MVFLQVRAQRVKQLLRRSDIKQYIDRNGDIQFIFQHHQQIQDSDGFQAKIIDEIAIRFYFHSAFDDTLQTRQDIIHYSIAI
ncbi:hypothetical protein AYJ10_24760 [Serratia marcescens]|nr:hypothetical protein AYJ10_24760 [Serratia marcescens]